MGINGIVRSEQGQVQTQSHQISKQAEVSFQTLLDGKARELNFSKHAAKRLDERGISMDKSLMGDLEHAVEEARKKGAKDLAVIGKEGVFIVNVPNNVVVTTMSPTDMKDKIMTNIDSAVFM